MIVVVVDSDSHSQQVLQRRIGTVGGLDWHIRRMIFDLRLMNNISYMSLVALAT